MNKNIFYLTTSSVLIFLFLLIPTTSYSYTQVLYQGIYDSPEVVELQGDLRELGYYFGGIDGDFGAMTYNAVRSFQTAKNLDPDGIVGPLTYKMLESEIERHNSEKIHVQNVSTDVAAPWREYYEPLSPQEIQELEEMISTFWDDHDITDVEEPWREYYVPLSPQEIQELDEMISIFCSEHPYYSSCSSL